MQETVAQPGRTSQIIKRIFGIILLLATAAVFLFSGITKLIDFARFTWNIMDAGVSSMVFASILGRLFIGFELLLGFFLLAHLFLRSFTYPAVIALLGVFTIYLIVLIARQGDGGNCGCFGDQLEMKPSMAIVKNIVMIITTFILMKIYPIRPYKNSEWMAGLIGMACLVVPFVVLPLSGDTKPDVVSRHIDLTPLYHSEKPENNPPTIDLKQGKHIVAFMSLTCPHCKKAAFLLQVIYRQHPQLPIFFVLNGHPDLEADFFKETHSEHVPYILFRGGDEFMSMAGTSVPAIYYINNSVVEREANYYELDPQYMEDWLKAH